MKRKLTAAITTAALALTMLSGCGNTENPLSLPGGAGSLLLGGFADAAIFKGEGGAGEEIFLP